MYCASLCNGNHNQDGYEPCRQLSNLGPYDHLARFYRFCVTHGKRNIFGLKTYVSTEVYAAMLSLLSSEEHPNLDHAFTIIRAGGRKATSMSIIIHPFIIY